MVALLEAQVLTIRMVRGRMVEKPGKMVEKGGKCEKNMSKRWKLVIKYTKMWQHVAGTKRNCSGKQQKTVGFKLNK